MGQHRKSIVRQVIERLDGKMAINESRYEAKKVFCKEHGKTWSVSTGHIHSFKTRSVYQEHTIRFVKWAREQHHMISLEQLDPRANELTSLYLQQHVQDGKSPYTLQVERAALRLFFDSRSLAGDVTLPRRERQMITRSRGSVAQDRHFQPANWQPLIQFLKATGLRRQELCNLTCGDIYREPDGRVYVHVESGKGGRSREVPVLPGRDQDVWGMTEGHTSDERAFDRVPKNLDIHALRREFAQELYLFHSPGRSLPSPEGRLRRNDYDRDAAERVTWALGHNRIDVVLRHYIR